MNLDAILRAELAALEKADLRRVLCATDGPSGKLLNFAANDYLGLSRHPALIEAARAATAQHGAGAGSSRLITGTDTAVLALEEQLAAWKETEAALMFGSGYAAALGTIPALAGKDDTVILDKLVHASLIDAARLSGATVRVFPHNRMEKLEALLQKVSSAPGRGRILVVTESIFSMDGDAAPLREMAALKEKYGAWLMVDEAHATGLYGKNRRGLAEELGVGGRIEVQMGTLGKALGAGGGYICGSRTLIDLLVNRARSFIFSTAPVPAAAAAATAGVRFVQSREGEARRKLLWSRVGHLQPKIKNQKSKIPAAIIPVMIGDEKKAVELAAALGEHGIFVPAIRYPTVARGHARLRVTLTAAHSSEDILQLTGALKTLGVRL